VSFLLLDDILSELDPTRRGYVLGQAGRAGQTLISTTDLTDFPTEFLSEASLYRVSGGSLTKIEPNQGTNGGWPKAASTVPTRLAAAPAWWRSGHPKPEGDLRARQPVPAELFPGYPARRCSV